MPAEEMWRAINAFREANPAHWLAREPDLQWDPDIERGTDMPENKRVPIYRAIVDALGRSLTMSERGLIDKCLDQVGVSRR